MNTDELREKLESIDYDIVYELWQEHCHQESPKQWQLVDELMDIAEQDSDTKQAIETKLMQKVDVIASGYCWICPDCKIYNTQIEYTEIVECSKCGKRFETNLPEHAF